MEVEIVENNNDNKYLKKFRWGVVVYKYFDNMSDSMIAKKVGCSKSGANFYGKLIKNTILLNIDPKIADKKWMEIAQIFMQC